MVASVGEEKIIAQNELKNHQYSSAHFPLCSIDGCWIFRAFPRMFAPYPETQFSLGFGGRSLPTDFQLKHHWVAGLHHFLSKHAFYVASLMILIWENIPGSSWSLITGQTPWARESLPYLFSKHSFFKLYQWFFTMENCRVFPTLFFTTTHLQEAPVLYFLLPVRSVKNEVENESL